MKPKKLLAIGLVLFVVASVVTLAVKNVGRNLPAAGPLDDGVIVYYFHGKNRCPTCVNIEAYARDAIESAFAEQLRDGWLRWQVVNYEEPGSEHFRKDYELIVPSVVLVRIDGGAPTQWSTLSRTWQLVDDKAAFRRYVEQETRAFLERG